MNAPAGRMWTLPSWLLNQAASRANRLVNDAFGGAGTRVTYGMLAVINEFAPISQAELGRRLGIDRSDITSALDTLERDGLASRGRDGSDRRRNAIRITPAGVDALRELDGAAGSAQERLVAPLSPAERVQFTAMLHRILEHHDGVRRTG